MKRLILIACLTVMLGSIVGAAQKKDDFREGIKKHQDWIEKYKKGFDPRVIYVLAQRAGLTVKMNDAKEMTEYFKAKPEGVDEFFLKHRMNIDAQAYVDEEIIKWKELYGGDALLYQTKHYQIMGVKRDKLFLQYLKYYMERIFKYYKNKIDSDEKVEGRFLVMLYGSRADYVKTCPGMKWSGAYFSASKRALVGFVPREFSSNQTWLAQTLIKTFFHEGWHQYMRYHVPEAPIFINEGLAQMMECTQVDRSKLKENGNVNYDTVKAAKKIVTSNSYMPMKKMVYLTIQEFQQNPKLCYPQSYAMTHFLKKGPSKYKKMFKKTILLLRQAKGGKETLDEVFGDVDWKKFEKDWKKYTLKLDQVDRPNYFKK